MKKILMAVIVVALVAMAGSAMAAGSNTLTVSASVTGTCKFSSGTSTLSFGALDPSAGTLVNGSTTTQFWCTKGVTTDAITSGQGLNYTGTKNAMKDPVSADIIPYTLTLTKDGTANAGPGTLRTLTIAGQVLGTDYTGKSVGTYSDTVLLSIDP